MADIKTLKADIPKVAAILGKRVGDMMAEIALTLYGEITKRNPVDTGYSHANWNVAIGNPDVTVEPSSPPAKGGAVLPIKPFPSLHIDGKHPVFITNSVYYVQYLENGTEKMAPRPMVRPALQRTQARIKAIIEAAKKR